MHNSQFVDCADRRSVSGDGGIGGVLGGRGGVLGGRGGVLCGIGVIRAVCRQEGN